MMIDTHTHLYDEETVALQDEHILRAIRAGVEKLYMPNCDSTTIYGMMSLAKRFPEHCFAMMGLHPCYVKENYKDADEYCCLFVIDEGFAGFIYLPYPND